MALKSVFCVLHNKGTLPLNLFARSLFSSFLYKFYVARGNAKVKNLFSGASLNSSSRVEISQKDIKKKYLKFIH